MPYNLNSWIILNLIWYQMDVLFESSLENTVKITMNRALPGFTTEYHEMIQMDIASANITMSWEGGGEGSIAYIGMYSIWSFP